MDRNEAYFEYLKEKQKRNIELLKVWTALIIATTGGIVGLFFKLNHKISIPLIGLGVWLDLFFVLAFICLLLDMERNSKEMRKWIEKF